MNQLVRANAEYDDDDDDDVEEGGGPSGLRGANAVEVV